MSKQARVSHPLYSLLPADVKGFDSLAELALDLRWSWDHAADEVYGGEPRTAGDGRTLANWVGSRAAVFTAWLCLRPTHRRTIRQRVIPHCDGVAIPLEDARILWQQ